MYTEQTVLMTPAVLIQFDMDILNYMPIALLCISFIPAIPRKGFRSADCVQRDRYVDSVYSVTIS